MDTRVRWRLISRNFPRAIKCSGIILYLVIVSTVSLEGVAQESDDAAASLRAAAKQGNADAQYDLGWMYAGGRGVAQDNVEAVWWFRMAAEQGLAAAQYILGVAYAAAQGVAQDDVEAVWWFRMAAEQGNADAQRDLGWMYASGRGVAQDYAEAYGWIGTAAAQRQGGTLDDRRALLGHMTPFQVERGEELEREYREKYVMR